MYLVLKVTAIALLLAACQSASALPAAQSEPGAAPPDTPRFQSPTASPVTGTAAPSPTPARGGAVVVGGLSQPDTFHPWRAESEAARALIPLLYDSLLTTDPVSGRLLPALATSWEVSPDSRTVTFTLRSDAHWPDGVAVTADDVRATLQAVLDPALDSLHGARLRYVEAVTATDTRTVVVHLATPDCPTVAYVGEVPIVPAAWADRLQVAATAPLTAPVPGSGPFTLDPTSSADEWRLVRNPEAQPAPHLDRLVYRVFDSPDALHAALSESKIDVAWFPAGAQAHPDTRLIRLTYPTGPYLAILFNNDHPVLSDGRVRTALSLAVDRSAILKEVTDNRGALLAGPLPPFHWAADPTLSPPPYDPQRARDLLAEAGWRDSDGDGWLDRDGERLRLPVRTNGGNPWRETTAMLVVSDYRALGIDARVEIVAWPTLVGDLFTHYFAAVVFGWPLDSEPDQRALWLSTENAVGSGLNMVSFADTEVDSWLAEAATFPGCAATGRADLYRRVQARLAELGPYDFLVVPAATLMTRPTLVGPSPGSYASPFWNATEWYLRGE
jgi:peptide/nickel transport system substrate-binding protein